MIATAMELACPATVRDALEALGSAEDARVLAGGMSLIPLLNLGAAPAPAVLVSLNHVEGLDAVVQHNAVLRIGATARHAAVAQLSARWPHVGLLSAAAASIGDVQVRNRGTIAGSIAQADPSADLIAAAMALGGDVVLRNAEGGRRLPVRDFVVGPNRTALEPGELITAVEVPLRANQGWAYRRISRTRGSAPQVCAAAHRTDDVWTVVVAGAAARPVLVTAQGGSAEEAASELLEALAVAVADEPPDERLPEEEQEYRRALGAVVLSRALEGLQVEGAA